MHRFDWRKPFTNLNGMSWVNYYRDIMLNLTGNLYL